MSATDKRLDWTRPRVAVRKRTLNETLDLTLRVLGREFKPLAYYYALVAAPVFLLDLAILAPFLLMGDGRRPELDSSSTRRRPLFRNRSRRFL